MRAVNEGATEVVVELVKAGANLDLQNTVCQYIQYKDTSLQLFFPPSPSPNAWVQSDSFYCIALPYMVRYIMLCSVRVVYMTGREKYVFQCQCVSYYTCLSSHRMEGVH